MSLYTTGELAKKCNVSVRTIQYYDERGILVPTDLTEGGTKTVLRRGCCHIGNDLLFKRFGYLYKRYC